MQTVEDKVISRIYGRGRGWAFGANDFSAEFGRSTIDWVLYNLVAAGTIRHVCRGICDYPKFSELLQQKLSPDFDQLAQAFARKFNWRIQPSGDAALNLLGLSIQVPGRLVYRADDELPCCGFLLKSCRNDGGSKTCWMGDGVYIQA
ncbi:MAG: DUF6088 family protein [Nitrosomonas sp.]|uniref:DUF6088 family protein n=1 Tax=Nitrosomonas sp. TaxID=42353 RepID=UPI0027350020|nr:DUF6088 family protein [Nitrosomonas sp.]MDP3661924.1 DUF6088 family protein [Nitrosomonas sp.]MDZ4106253.1 DUF6088 family protein [Nitrosomonas sp.]